MQESETIPEFNSKLCDIANEAFGLGEKILEEKLVRKALRSLPRRFAYKVTTIEEAKDIQAMKLDELMGSLRTFEMNFNEDKKEKEIALQAEVGKSHHEEDSDDHEDLHESLDLLLQEVPCETYLRERPFPQKMREDHRLDALDGDNAYDLCQTSERRFQKVNVGQRILLSMCPHTNVMGTSKR